MDFPTLRERLAERRPLSVAYGMGVDSTAMLVELARRWRAGAAECRPDLILFADTGGEKPDAYLPVIQRWLAEAGFPAVETVRYRPKRPRNGMYTTLEENCLVNRTLPSLAFGYKRCSLKWKREPQDRYHRRWPPARDAWARGLKVIKAIGYDAGPRDSRRSHIRDDAGYEYWYPLRELGWDRERCVAEIRREGLPVPAKSACFFCPASKPHEIERLAREHPELAERIVALERNAAPHLRTVEGLWRRRTRTRPGSITPAELDRWEALGLITIHRPAHPATGLPYSEEHWSLEVADEVADWFDDGELDHDALDAWTERSEHEPLRSALMELCEALDPQHQGVDWPDPIAWDGRPLRVQAEHLLSVADAEHEDPQVRRVAEAAEDLRQALEAHTERSET